MSWNLLITVYNCLYSHYLSAWQCMKIQRRNLTFTIMTPPSRYLQMALHWAAWVKATPSQRQTFYKETIWDPEKRGWAVLVCCCCCFNFELFSPYFISWVVHHIQISSFLNLNITKKKHFTAYYLKGPVSISDLH